MSVNRTSTWALSAAALGIFAFVGALGTFAPEAATEGALKTRECIAQQFIEHGFVISSVSTTRHSGHVAGARRDELPITINFTADRQELHFDKRLNSINLDVAANAFEAIRLLANSVGRQCRSQSASAHFAGAIPN